MIQSLLAQARFGRADLVLEQLDSLLPSLENGQDSDVLMLGLYLRALALRVLGAPTDESLAACDLLEQAAQQRRTHGWTATAWALRARVRVDSGAIGEASKRWTMPIVGWKQALNHFAILFEGRMPELTSK